MTFRVHLPPQLFYGFVHSYALNPPGVNGEPEVCTDEGHRDIIRSASMPAFSPIIACQQ